jgi:TonB family protein
MLFRSVCIAFAGALSIGAAQAEFEPPLLHPTGKWVLDYAETQCMASRTYGDPADQVTFGISPSPYVDTYKLLVVRHRAGPEKALELKGSVDFGKGPIDSWLLHYGNREKRHDLYQFRITAAEMAQADTAAKVTLRSKGGPDVALALEDMKSLITGLEACAADLRRHWNADSEAATPARGDVRSVFSSDDYPREAYNRDQEGSAQYILLVDETGKVAGCDVVEASGVPALDAMGCQVIRERVKFKPARDSKGKAVRDTVTTPKVVWRLEG